MGWDGGQTTSNNVNGVKPLRDILLKYTAEINHLIVADPEVAATIVYLKRGASCCSCAKMAFTYTPVQIEGAVATRADPGVAAPGHRGRVDRMEDAKQFPGARVQTHLLLVCQEIQVLLPSKAGTSIKCEQL